MRRIFISALLAMLCLPHLALAQQGRLPKPVQPLPSYPPVVCVAPNWKTESCEERQEVSWWIPFLEMMKFFEMADKSWLGTALRHDQPQAWDGTWPERTQYVNKSGWRMWDLPQKTTVLLFEPGGVLGEHVNRFKRLANSGDSVEIRGPCFSACTMIVAYVPKERLCFGDYASLNFHHAGSYASAADAWAATQWMYQQYPQEIREWLDTQGGAESLPMPFVGWWTLESEELWKMGYRKCEPKPAEPMTIIKKAS